MNKTNNCSNKENRGSSPNSFGSLSEEERLKKLQTMVVSASTPHREGCQNIEISQLSPQAFKKAYNSDPMFKTKVELMFNEEQKLLKTHGQMISKVRLDKKDKDDPTWQEFEKEGTLKQRTALKVLNFVDLCQKLRTFLGGQDK